MRSLVMRADDNNAGDFLTAEQAAQLVGRSHWTIREWYRRGLLVKYKSASLTVVSRKELIELVKPKIAGDR